MKPFWILPAIATVATGSCIAFWSYKTSAYPSVAKKHLRKALLGHYFIPASELPNLVQDEYCAAIRACLGSGMAKESPEVVGIREHLADYYRLINQHHKRISVLQSIFEDCTQSEQNDEPTNRNAALKAAQLLSEHMLDLNDSQSAKVYLEWIVKEGIKGNVTPLQLGSAFELLGNIYATENHFDWAIPSYMSSLAMLQQDNTTDSREKVCRSAIIHNNLADCFLNSKSIDKALDFAQIALDTSISASPSCQSCEPAIYCNLAEIKRILGRNDDALRDYQSALSIAERLGSTEGVQHAQSGIDLLKRHN